MPVPTDLSPHALLAASRHLAQVDADWAGHIDRVGPCLLQAKPLREPYEALIRAVAYQQLHAKAGDAILARFLALYPDNIFPAPAELLATSEERQRACGFSASKLVAIRGIAEATLVGQVPPGHIAVRMPDALLIEQLSALRGIGRWTVEMFLIYSLQRPDILPADDFGVREGYRRLKGLSTAPTARQMRVIGEAWSPFRTVASWYLWRSTE